MLKCSYYLNGRFKMTAKVDVDAVEASWRADPSTIKVERTAKCLRITTTNNTILEYRHS